MRHRLIRITQAIRESLQGPEAPDKIETTDERIKSDPNHVGHCTWHGAVAHSNWRCPKCNQEVSA